MLGGGVGLGDETEVLENFHSTHGGAASARWSGAAEPSGFCVGFNRCPTIWLFGIEHRLVLSRRSYCIKHRPLIKAVMQVLLISILLGATREDCVRSCSRKLLGLPCGMRCALLS